MKIIEAAALALLLFYLQQCLADAWEFGDGPFILSFIAPLLILIVIWFVELILHIRRAGLSEITGVFRGRGELSQRIRKWRIRLQLVFIAAFGVLVILNSIFLIPLVEDPTATGLELEPHVRWIYRQLGVNDLVSAARFAGSRVWGYGLLLLALYAAYVLYRRRTENKARECRLRIYRLLAQETIGLREDGNDQSAKRARYALLINTSLECLLGAASAGLTVWAIRKLLNTEHFGFIFVPDTDRRKHRFDYLNEVYSSDPLLVAPLKRMAATHKPVEVSDEGLKYVWNGCLRNGDLDVDAFREQHTMFWSATGAACHFERSLVFLKHEEFFGADIPFYRQRGLGERRFPCLSYLAVPIKHSGRVVAVAFLGSTSAMGFNRRMLSIVESISHTIGEVLVALNEEQLLEFIGGPQIRLDKYAKNFVPITEIEDSENMVEQMKAVLRKGGKGARPFA